MDKFANETNLEHFRKLQCENGHFFFVTSSIFKMGTHDDFNKTLSKLE